MDNAKVFMRLKYLNILFDLFSFFGCSSQFMHYFHFALICVCKLVYKPATLETSSLFDYVIVLSFYNFSCIYNLTCLENLYSFLIFTWKGKYQSTDNTKIGKEIGNSYQKNEEIYR